MRIRPVLLVRLTAGLLLLAGIAAGHGVFQKRLWNAGKENRATRGTTPGTNPTRLFMMQPAQYLTGTRQSVGFSAVLQDQEASTMEQCVFSYVKYAANGRDPDVSATGTIGSLTVRLFGFGMQGTLAREFTVTIGRQIALPETFGIAVELPGHPKWPLDGASLHAQLNLPQDSRRPRVPAPHDKQVWAFEQIARTGPAVPLGGRALDVLNVTGLYTEPVLQLSIRTTAYELGTEEIWGPEAYHPSAARGDAVGLFLDGGPSHAESWGILFVSPTRTRAPIPFPPGRTPPMHFYLDLKPPFPLPFLVGKLSVIGSMSMEPKALASFPRDFRSFWLQAVLINPASELTEVTGAVHVLGQ